MTIPSSGSARSTSGFGLYEVLGRITDNHDVSSSWESTQPQPCQYPEQLIWRDIDPTVLARSMAFPPPGRPWFSPAGARFPSRGS